MSDTRQTGSLVNNLYAGVDPRTQIVPEVGMGATMLMYSDRHAGTIVEVSPSGKSFIFKRDNAKRVDKNGMSDSQEYEYTTNHHASPELVRKAKNGYWYTKGGMKNGTQVALGFRREYCDFSF